MFEFGALIFATFGALVPITNPFSTAPVFASLSRRFSVDRRNQQAWMACVYTAGTLTVALVAGALIMSFFGISLPALRIAGGLVVARVGFGMLNPEPEQELPDESRDEAMQMRDIAFTPISMPLLSGPGSIAMTIGMASEASNVLEYAGIGIGIVLTALFAWLILRSSTRVAEVLGVTGMNVLTRLMGLVLVCIGVQFVLRGLLESIVHPSVADSLRQAFGG
ncbi:MAG: MarC family NAAT transporter [Pseudomonadales bacterium]